jgi:hypothetical protein
MNNSLIALFSSLLICVSSFVSGDFLYTVHDVGTLPKQDLLTTTVLLSENIFWKEIMSIFYGLLKEDMR